MTKRGHFIINGSPRVIINQMIRSPGIYYQQTIDKNKKRTYYADLISHRGTWLRLETDKKRRVWARMKKTPKISILIFLQSMGLKSEIIFQSIHYSEFLKNSFLKQNHPISTEQALIELYSKTHPKKDKTEISPEMGQKLLFRKFMNPRVYDLGKLGRIQLNKKLGLSLPLNITTLTPHDILFATDYLIKLEYGLGATDDIDHLKNRRVRASGELIQNQLGTGLIRLEKVIREKIKKPKKKLTIRSLITTKSVNGALREFFGSSQLSQFMDQTNPLAEITHKRRLSSLGPGGVSRETAGMAVRGIHPSHYGRICPIETPEGPNAGLVNSITAYARMNLEGFIETPFYNVYQGQIQKKVGPVFFSAEHEENLNIAPGDLKGNLLNFLPKNLLPIRNSEEFKRVSRSQIDYIAISPIQMISIATSMIPFLEHDDANRALMGSNMQRQAVPLLAPERPFVGTGLEARVVSDCGHILQTKNSGFISYVSGQKILVHTFALTKSQKNLGISAWERTLFESNKFKSTKLSETEPRDFNEQGLTFSLRRELYSSLGPRAISHFVREAQEQKQKVSSSQINSLHTKNSKRTRNNFYFDPNQNDFFTLKNFSFLVAKEYSVSNLTSKSLNSNRQENKRIYCNDFKSFLTIPFNLNKLIAQDRLEVNINSSKKSIISNRRFKYFFNSNKRILHLFELKKYFGDPNSLNKINQLCDQSYQSCPEEKTILNKSIQNITLRLLLLNPRFSLFSDASRLFLLKATKATTPLNYSSYLSYLEHEIIGSFLVNQQNDKSDSKKMINFFKKSLNFFQKKTSFTSGFFLKKIYPLKTKEFAAACKQSLQREVYLIEKNKVDFSLFNNLEFSISKTLKMSSTELVLLREKFISKKIKVDISILKIFDSNSPVPLSSSGVNTFATTSVVSHQVKKAASNVREKSFRDKQKKQEAVFEKNATNKSNPMNVNWFLESKNLDKRDFKYIKKKLFYKFKSQKNDLSKKSYWWYNQAFYLKKKTLKKKLKENNKENKKLFSHGFFNWTKSQFYNSNNKNKVLLDSKRVLAQEESSKTFIFSLSLIEQKQENCSNQYWNCLVLFSRYLNENFFATLAIDYWGIPTSLSNFSVKKNSHFSKTSKKYFEKTEIYKTSFTKEKTLPINSLNKFNTFPWAKKIWKLKSNTYNLQNYNRSNQDTCLNQRPIVREGEWVQRGDLLADGSASVGGELSLGKNILVAYMPWEGFNFEDAILINERLIYDDIYTSIHIERYEIEIRDTKFGIEQITNQIPEVEFSDISHLNDKGIAKIGTWVKESDILVGKITPIQKKPLSPHEKLLYDIVGKDIPTTRDTSLRIPKSVQGRVVDIQILDTENIPPETAFEGPGRVHIYIAEKRKIQVGDKMAGRHGNKGIVSKILPRQDMPYLPDGTPIDMVLNPLGVPSRMNVGQIFECLLGLAGKYLIQQFKIVPFDEIYGPEASRSLVYSKLFEARIKTGQDWLFDPNFPGKTKIFDGRTGESFDQPVTVGQAYMLKLVHLVDEKIHARSTGPYSLVTQQPLRGRSKHGGQRLGEMEVWAIEGFGAAYTLQELLTVKSDDMRGRHQVMDAILNNKPIALGTPESFKVLIRELQSLCLDVGVYTIDSTGRRKQIDIMKLP